MRPTTNALRLAILGASIGIAACSSTTSSPPPDGLLPLGTWGGENAGMIVGDTAMHLHVGCTFGDVSGRVAVGTNGAFDVQGSYTLRAFPIVVGPSVPARFVGKVEGGKTTVTVTVNDTVEKKTVVLGPVVVTLGVDPKMGPCPICRRPIVTVGRHHQQIALDDLVRLQGRRPGLEQPMHDAGLHVPADQSSRIQPF